MALIVQKYGGTSVADIDRIKAVAMRAVETAKQGNKVIVVVSAMSGETDKLTAFAHDITGRPDEREMDMLLSSGERVTSSLMAMAIMELGYGSISLTGRQVGIITDSSHTKAMIESIGSDRLKEALDENKIPVVAGFQGINELSDVTTLGRGGSDTTAVAIAAALNADICEIYTDVEGVYTADPRLVPDTRKMERISYDEMLEMASLGAKVLHERAVEFAKKYNVPLVVRSSFNNAPGTLVTKEDGDMEKSVVTGVAHNKNQARITIMGIPDRPGIAAAIFDDIAKANLNVDMIVQNISVSDNATDLSFTVSKAESEKALEITQKVSDKLNAKGVDMNKDVAKVSIVGVGMQSHFGVAAQMFDVLSKNGINIMMISTSEIKVSCVIDVGQVDAAVQALHDSFELAKQ
ncbi:aspartokinase [bacterium BMS3Abin09]|nr:aspartokinase [bacterium BMS3Abin09]GBE41436.1 aspartokinase [bacterium BMS3Bbin09]HDN94847.1 aspartate kinase [Nitrospirota bacterium]